MARRVEVAQPGLRAVGRDERDAAPGLVALGELPQLLLHPRAPPYSHHVGTPCTMARCLRVSTTIPLLVE